MMAHQHAAWLIIVIVFAFSLGLWGRYGRQAAWGVLATAVLVPAAVTLLLGGWRFLDADFLVDAALPLALFLGFPPAAFGILIAALFRRLQLHPPAP
jgi:hypothetical protein